MKNVLNKINSPKDLKNLDNSELEYLASDIRANLIAYTSLNGGHLSSNLGVVELTIALHKYYNSPEDKIIFDVGHQAYVHKMLTGRKEDFLNLRKKDGLSGFQKRQESIHDVWEAGHSSTSLSAAVGFSIARGLEKENNSIISVIGDGSLTSGMALEALNHIGENKEKIIIILNDNNFSISKNIGLVNNLLKNLRGRPMYQSTKQHVKEYLGHVPKIGDDIISIMSNTKKNIKDLVFKNEAFYSDLGYTYLGPIDGHDIESMLSVFKKIEKIDGPVIVHAITEKGKGYTPAEMNKDFWHGVPTFDIKTGEPIKKQQTTSWSKFVSGYLETKAQDDEKLVVISPAMIKGSALEEIQKKFPERVIDVGIAEEHGATLISSLSFEGYKPFYSIYSTFLQRAYDQILHDNAMQNSNVTLGIDRAGIVGEDGETHQGLFDISFLRNIPNMTITMPYDTNEMTQILDMSFEVKSPFVVRYSKDPIIETQNSDKVEYGTWSELEKGEDAYIISFGPVLSRCLEAKSILEMKNINVSVINARFIKPMDTNKLSEILNSNKPVVIVEEGIKSGGFASGILEYQNKINNHSKIEIIAVDDQFVKQGKRDEMLDSVGFSPENIASKMEELYEK